MGERLMKMIQRLIAKNPNPECTTTEEQLQANKKLVEEFYNSTGAAKAALIHKDYIQHDPAFEKRAEAKDCSDYDEIVDFIMQAAAKVSSEPDNRELEILIAERDIVAAVIKRTKTDPDPTAPPDRTYDLFRFDVFRIKDGQLFEHWDGVDIGPPAFVG
jgi:predicted SnoaL-like aldol condensation-catalyzing enzyme